MGPLKGNTLGEKHRNYNTLLKEKIAKGPADLPKINYDDDDIDNMMKIDIACKERNVDYIMEVLKCDDMLYVTRAIKRSTWLITESEYAHLINPDYLHSNVFPDMTTKAVTKLMLHIKRHLKDEKRVEDFFCYVDKKDSKMAFKWLENSSLSFTEQIVKSRANSISFEILRRLCKKSVRILQVYIDNTDRYNRNICLDNFLFLLKSNTEDFLNIIESLSYYNSIPLTFKKKHTEILMKRCFHRIIDSIRNYRSSIDLSTLVRYLKKNCIDIETFLLTKYDSQWLNFDNIKPFLDELPQERIVNLLRKLRGELNSSDNIYTDHDSYCSEDAIEGISNDSDTEAISGTSDSSDGKLNDVEELFNAIEPNNCAFSHIYRWYEFTPFKIALRDLQRFIYAESSAEERHSMLIVLLTNARKNMELVRTVLQYYHDKHINEPFMYKIRFVNSVLTKHDAFRFDETTWSILNELFHSLEVYIQSTNKVQYCLITIILRNILHGQPVHAIVEQKFMFNSLIIMKKKLNHDEQVKLFDYLYHQMVEKLRSVDINRETGMKEAVTLVGNILTLIKDWKKEETHHQVVIDYIIKLSNLNKQLSWDTDMRSLYCSVKPYHRQLFENSLLLYPCEEMCINALKHDPGLLGRYKTEVTTLCHNDKVSLRTFLSKLRIYWRESLASDWRSSFIHDLKAFSGHGALVRNIFALSPQKSLLDFVKKYIPCDDKIQWGEAVESDISLRKHIAKSMHLARPQISVEVVLWYAKGDYLQYTHLSLNAIYYNLRSKDIENHIKVLLSSSVSVQKHGIRLASKRMKTEELLQTFPLIWKSTRNSSIRTLLFTSVFKILCNTEETFIKDSWTVLSFMIDDLNCEENKIIYKTLGSVKNVPLSVIGEYYDKAFVFLKELPKRIGVEDVFNHVFEYATNIIQYLDPVFLEHTVLISVYDIFVQKNYTLLDIMAAYLLCSKDEATQLQKYINLFEPLFVTCVPKWKTKEFEPNVIDSFQVLLTSIKKKLPRFVFEMNMIMPVKMLTNIQNVLQKELCKEEFYSDITHWRLCVAYIRLLDDMMIENPGTYHSWKEILKHSVKKYADICLEYLKEDIESFFLTIYELFANAMNQTIYEFEMEPELKLQLLDAMLIVKDDQVYMLVLNLFSENKDCASSYIIGNIKRKLYCYPSSELRMHYNAQYSERYNIVTSGSDMSSRSSSSSSNSSSTSELETKSQNTDSEFDEENSENDKSESDEGLSVENDSQNFEKSVKVSSKSSCNLI